MVQILVGVVIGVVGSLVAWWIVARAVRPRILISPKISRLPEWRRDVPWRYRVKVVNGSRRWPLPRSPLVDVRIVATLRFRGLDEKLPRNTNNYTLPLPHDGVVPYLSTNTLVRVRASSSQLQTHTRTRPPRRSLTIQRPISRMGSSVSPPERGVSISCRPHLTTPTRARRKASGV
jgi:hypothetical protein